MLNDILPSDISQFLHLQLKDYFFKKLQERRRFDISWVAVDTTVPENAKNSIQS